MQEQPDPARRAQPSADPATSPAHRGSDSRSAAGTLLPILPGGAGALGVGVQQSCGSGRKPAAGESAPCPGRAEPLVVGSVQRPSCFICSSTPFTNRTKSTLLGGMPRPYGSSLNALALVTSAYGSCAASPARTVSSPVMPSALPCWNSTRQPVSLSAVIGLTVGLPVCRLSRLVDAARARRSSGRTGPRALGRRRSPADQHLLAGAVVLGGEGDLLPAVAGDRHVPGDDVDRASAMQHGKPLRGRRSPAARPGAVRSPKIASATAWTMSMSKPSILPVSGFREPSR